MAAQIVALPDRNVQDIPRALRTLADEIEQGKLGKVLTIAWVLDIAEAPVEVGLLGAAAEAASAAHLLFGKAMRALEL